MFEHHSIFVERLEGPGDVGRDLHQETRVGVAVGIDGLLARAKLAHGNLAQDAKTFIARVPQRRSGALVSSGSVVGSVTRMRIA